jgi:hypothetical protein
MADEITQITFYINTFTREKVMEKLEKLGIVGKGNITIQTFPKSHTFAKYITDVQNLDTSKCLNCSHDEQSHEDDKSTLIHHRCYGLFNNQLCGCIKFIKMT